MIKLKSKLMDHQNRAFQKLKNIKVNALFMDMGTGKTRTLFEFIKHRENKISNVIYFCPVTLKQTVYEEFDKHTNLIKQNKVLLITKETEKTIEDSYFVYIAGIESIQSSPRVFFTLLNKIINDKSYIIIDESHFIKNFKSNRFERLCYLSKNCKYKTIMTGTPITKNIADLYAQFKFLSSKILGFSSFYSFAANHLVYSDKYPGMITQVLNEEEIAWKIKPFIYQVKKEECIDLPEKNYQNYYFELNEDQEELYNFAKDFTLSKEELDSYDLFALFSELKQIVSGFYNTKKYTKLLSNPRLNILKDIAFSTNKRDKILIWCTYTFDIYQIRRILLKNGLQNDELLLYYGGLTIKERNENIEKFKRNGKVLILNQKIGGQGLTLNDATYSIFYNNDFNWATRNQAECRNYRIGQKNKVIYIDIIANCGIDKRIQENLNKKESLITSFRKEIDKIKDNKEKTKYIKNVIRNI